MRWMLSNVVIDRDPAGNIKPTKGKSSGKIDGVVAAIMAIGASIRPDQSAVRSVYDPVDVPNNNNNKSWYDN